MSTAPFDTSPEARARQVDALRRIGPEARLSIAIDLSESAHAIHLAGLRARHPDWDEDEAIRHVIESRYGLTIPRRP